ncbi:MAG: glutamine--fructose-6-phosphate transaminase (isomerizing) [Fluviicoccus sp.]|uniref:glutamine--fructose-6-phosphate transaminase (isomerizing) n=1 Tax=Fluviicoccus sp. TaxID=2003552 RepID=UPI0027291997|nr:glutamine--fructose-6-phosphate transaminase (isomerizing) [Fluviicoccus sp.]MDO8329698.1 glutamine--fructose-6-phosphate transaminase (isomerizing) [Fluviicoccus sp.]
MCGIVGAVAERNVSGILLEGLKRLEYRGYDSAGLAVIDKDCIHRERRTGKVRELEAAVNEAGLKGHIGIAHTRWATHGAPTQDNAHPHVSGDVAVVHNGIIENYESLRTELKAQGYEFVSQTDTEVVAHLVHRELQHTHDLFAAVKASVTYLHGAYALGIIRASEPGRLIAVRRGSPLVVGLGIGENFIGSDQLALLPVTNRFIYLDEADFAEIYRDEVRVYDGEGRPVQRDVTELDAQLHNSDKGGYRHYMLKEIYEQPQAIQRTLEGRIGAQGVDIQTFGVKAPEILARVRHIQIIACGTSYHAGYVARYWFEGLAGISCNVEVASEYRYRKSVLPENTLFVTISQSGETADTLAALREARRQGILASLCICNVPTSTLVRESDLSFITNAGPEIGVASTKAFTTQLVALMLLVLSAGKARGTLAADAESRIIRQLQNLPVVLESVLGMDKIIERMAADFGEKHHTLFLGRGSQYPVAMEGALKLKEISYIHAEAYPAGELKHGPLALVDRDMPVVVVAPNNDLLDKLKSNLQEVRARAGVVYVFADHNAHLTAEPGITVLPMPSVADEVAPIVYTVPLQLLSYHVAVIKGTDVDQPRNLAKSVTVE